MDLKELKALAQALGSVVLIEEGKPSLIVLELERYQALLTGQPAKSLAGEAANSGSVSEADPELVERLNRDIALLKEEIKKREIQELSEETVVD
ncbi:MAG: hypothetical protein UY30_C0011G0015 [Parcubacteria group bacterium GW2011_GWB1_48_6]|nr:MAG: hypothetical protein UY30_C0011G0015 [Parcubacteria group bacterium GW2011_GWB1_48_6]HXK35670.1 hypothetical protein [Candidatus Paceibacterota bacterium]